MKQLIIALAALLTAVSLPAQTTPTAAGDNQANFARRAQAAFVAAQKRHQAAPNDPEAAWQLGRASFDWAEFSTSRTERAAIAGEGIAACRELLARMPNSIAGHYYLGMNLAQMARTKRLGALPIVEDMEQEFATTLVLDAKFDFAGPDRNLGLLYHDAPGWPVSVGSKDKASQHLRAAVKIAPDYPENRLNLIEAELDWNDRASALIELKALAALWPAAKKQFIGEDWASTWPDWERRRATLSQKTAEIPAEPRKVGK